MKTLRVLIEIILLVFVPFLLTGVFLKHVLTSSKIKKQLILKNSQKTTKNSNL